MNLTSIFSHAAYIVGGVAYSSEETDLRSMYADLALKDAIPSFKKFLICKFFGAALIKLT